MTPKPAPRVRKKETGNAWPAYEEEVWAAGDWRLEHFNEDSWAIIGLIKTPSDGFTRDEVVGVVTGMYAQGIVDAHNAAMQEIRDFITNSRRVLSTIIGDTKKEEST